MFNLPAKPAGSDITVRNELNGVTLSWPNPRGGLMRYATTAFLLAWMGGWALGEFSVVRKLASGEANAFLIFWLIGWTVGGIWCASVLFNMLRPARPERLRLDSLRLSYEPGTAPIEGFGSNDGGRRDALDWIKPRRKVVADKRDVGDIRIDRVGERLRLTVDVGAKRVEIGEYLEEPEREWLLSVLKSWKAG